jgi:hypothetical protein|tara:strand:+ start:4247 stop:4387 length:141 start_codon:yes stop_codon:yes gene_type:complete
MATAKKKASPKKAAPKQTPRKKVASSLPPVGSAERKAMVLRGEIKE